MGVEIPSEVPSIFWAGETVKFSRAFADFPSGDGWKFSFHMNGATAVLHKSGVVQPNGSFLVTISPTDSNLAAGAYRYIERVTSADDSEVHTVGQGVIEVELDLATAPAGATLTHAERTLQIIEAAIEGRLPKDLQQYTIAGRIVTKIPIEQLQTMRGTYASIVWRQHNPGRLGPSIYVQFSEDASESTLPPTWEESLL